MTCSDVRRYLSAYLDSELETSISLSVNEHLERCEACAERFEQEAGLEAAIRDHLQATPSRPEFWAGVDASLDRADRRRTPWWPVLAAALLLCAAGVWWVVRPGAVPAEGPGESQVMLTAVLRERVMDMQRDRSAIRGYHAADAAAAKALAEHHLGAGNVQLASIAPPHERIAPHDFVLLGAGTVFVGGEETPVLHYRCCGNPLYVFLIAPKALRRFPQCEQWLMEHGGLDRSEAIPVSLKRCPASGVVLAVAGTGCASPIATALVSR